MTTKDIYLLFVFCGTPFSFSNLVKNNFVHFSSLKSSVIDVWDPTSFFLLPSSLPFHTLWDMIMNNKGIFTEIWDQFVGGNVSGITF